ncbi:MAG TPA: KTSC domain-containing protein [Steroidobacteraceae bacterium]|nr:KTSC domain-containing protein [Steroidobacteraceae bacterium]
MPSAVIRSFDYDEARRELFQSGKRYVYRDVPPEIFARMKMAFSKGEFFNEHVRDRFAFVRDPLSE